MGMRTLSIPRQNWKQLALMCPLSSILRENLGKNQHYWKFLHHILHQNTRHSMHVITPWERTRVYSNTRWVQLKVELIVFYLWLKCLYCRLGLVSVQPCQSTSQANTICFPATLMLLGTVKRHCTAKAEC